MPNSWESRAYHLSDWFFETVTNTIVNRDVEPDVGQVFKLSLIPNVLGHWILIRQAKTFARRWYACDPSSRRSRRGELGEQADTIDVIQCSIAPNRVECRLAGALWPATFRSRTGVSSQPIVHLESLWKRAKQGLHSFLHMDTLLQTLCAVASGGRSPTKSSIASGGGIPSWNKSVIACNNI